MRIIKDTSVKVSIHAFRGEGDTRLRQRPAQARQFQSTPSGGKATRAAAQTARRAECFNPRLPGGRRRGHRNPPGDTSSFNPRLPGGRRRLARTFSFLPLPVSIHAFRGEGDPAPHRATHDPGSFNPRLPGGRRPTTARQRQAGIGVSIHAFRGEGDAIFGNPWQALIGFNPRLPGGRRRNAHQHAQTGRRFQSTPSGGKATV